MKLRLLMIIGMAVMAGCAGSVPPQVRVTGVSSTQEFNQNIFECQKESMVVMAGARGNNSQYKSSYGEKADCQLFYPCMKGRGITAERDLKAGRAS